MLSLNELIIATIFLPLLGAVVTGLFVRKIGDKRAQLMTCLPMVLSAIFAALIFCRVTQNGLSLIVPVSSWIVSGSMPKAASSSVP
mgnify:CR=1 FL=1